MLPALIEQTGLLSFISRRHLSSFQGQGGLREVPLRTTTMRRRLAVVHRTGGYLSPAASRLIDLLVHHARRRQ